MKEIFEKKKKPVYLNTKKAPRPRVIEGVTDNQLKIFCEIKEISFEIVKKVLTKEIIPETTREYKDRGGEIEQLDYFPGINFEGAETYDYN